MMLVKSFIVKAPELQRSHLSLQPKKILLTKRGQLSGTVTAVLTKNGAGCVAGVVILCAYIYACVCRCVGVWVGVYVHKYRHVCMYVFVCMYVCMY
jgi:hypothetical protein